VTEGVTAIPGCLAAMPVVAGTYGCDTTPFRTASKREINANTAESQQSITEIRIDNTREPGRATCIESRHGCRQPYTRGRSNCRWAVWRRSNLAIGYICKRLPLSQGRRKATFTWRMGAAGIITCILACTRCRSALRPKCGSNESSPGCPPLSACGVDQAWRSTV
jgi:hypothetical protein